MDTSPLLVHRSPVAVPHLSLFIPLGMGENLVPRRDWHPLCILLILSTERISSRGTMQSSFDEATHLSENGEALQQSSPIRQDYRGSEEFQDSPAHSYALHTYPRHEKRVITLLHGVDIGRRSPDNLATDNLAISKRNPFCPCVISRSFRHCVRLTSKVTLREYQGSASPKLAI